MATHTHFWLRRLGLAATCLCCMLSGCKGRMAATSAAQVQAERQAVLNTEREQLEMIPLPAKSQYMPIRSFESWQNPYLTVQPGMLELHVTRGDANPTPIGAGGLLRPVGARREELNVSLNELGAAISAVPGDAWPYGRVVAIEEAHKTPSSAEPAVRRNMEAAIAQLSDLGVVVYDPNEGKLQ